MRLKQVCKPSFQQPKRLHGQPWPVWLLSHPPPSFPQVYSSRSPRLPPPPPAPPPPPPSSSSSLCLPVDAHTSLKRREENKISPAFWFYCRNSIRKRANSTHHPSLSFFHPSHLHPHPIPSPSHHHPHPHHHPIPIPSTGCPPDPYLPIHSCPFPHGAPTRRWVSFLGVCVCCRQPTPREPQSFLLPLPLPLPLLLPPPPLPLPPRPHPHGCCR